MRFQLITCKVLQREAYLAAAESKHVVDIVIMPQGLHNEPDRLRSELQKAVSRTTDVRDLKYDATLLGYGLCSNGLAGIQSPITMVVPRAHDCITLLLGSKEAYREYFDRHPGTYWYSSGWIESQSQPGRERYEHTRKEYAEKYGEENAEFLMKTEQEWMSKYSRAAYVDWNTPLSDYYRKFTKECASYMKWQYDELKGSPRLLQSLVSGDWPAEDFLVLRPGEKISPDVNNPGIIKAV